MRRISLLTIVGLSFMMPTTLAAQEGQAPVAGEAPAKPEPKICKKNRATGSLTRVNKICRSETATGSVMAKRVCYTPEQLKAQQRQTDQDLRNLKK